jgi:predicted esterase
MITLLLALTAFAADREVSLFTPRGEAIRLDVYNHGAPTALLLAPGGSCSPRLDMYDSLAEQAKNKNITLVRLYWAYCVSTPQTRPSGDLSKEKEDFLTALSYVRTELKLADANIHVGGKSQGSYVSAPIFLEQKSLNSLVLLTPVCTDDGPRNAFAETYPGLDAETRPVYFIQGNADPLCETQHFQEYLKGKPTNFVPLVVGGNHGFGFPNPDGTYNAELGNKNLRAISKWLFSWLE